MVETGGGNYFHAMDREYAPNSTIEAPSDTHDHSSHNHSHNTGSVGLSTGDFGMSFGLGPVPNVPAILAKMRSGAKKLELGFMGMGKGGGQGHTAGMYGKKQRQALREAALANRMDFTTHTSVGVFGLAGQDRQGNFSRESKANSMQEIQRAIEFAADVGRGGPVVVHTGEFHRPISDSTWNTDGKWKDKFESFRGEEERASYRVVDTRTGGLVAEARKGRSVARPVWNRFEKKNEDMWELGMEKSRGKSWYVDENGVTVHQGDYVDYWGNKIDPSVRVPKFNAKIGDEGGEFEIHQMEWKDLVTEADELTDQAKAFWRKNKNASEKVWKESKWYRFYDRDKGRAVDQEQVRVRAEEAYILNTLETNAGNARGWALQYTRDFKNELKQKEKLEKALKLYTQIYAETDEEEKWKLKKVVDRDFAGLVPPDAKFPHEILKNQLDILKRGLRQSQEASASQWAQAQESVETMKHVESAETYALRESYDSYARAAVYAHDKNEELRKKGELKRDLFLGLENLFPEAYGAHPDEIIKIIKGSREKMVEVLKKERGMHVEKARKLAKDTIKITFDTGHFNMWRKYWKGDPKATIEENHKAFDQWSDDMLKKLAKEDMIGHVHLDDNYGYQDEHLAPGEGNAPIKAMIRILKEEGYDGDLIVEPGADFTTDLGGFHSVMKTWRLFDSPVYGTTGSFGSARGESTRWGQVQYNHFGQTAPPYFSFQPYTPSEDWTLWSGVPLE